MNRFGRVSNPETFEALCLTSSNRRPAFLMTRFLLLLGGYLGVVHYAIGLALTMWLAAASDSPGIYVWFSLPYFGIAAIFVFSVFLGHSRRIRASALALGLGLVVSAGAFAYDFKHARAQFGGGGIGNTYTIWWWYYEPFWYGYEPGNV